MTEREKDHPTDLEELRMWASRIVLVGGLAIGIIVVGLVVLAIWALSAAS